MQEQQPIFRNVRFRADLPIVLEMHVSTRIHREKAVDVDDQCMFMIECENGAFGSIEATKKCMGRNNYITFEIHGTLGSLYFNYERRDELQVCFASDPDDRRDSEPFIQDQIIHMEMDCGRFLLLVLVIQKLKLWNVMISSMLLQTIHRQARILKMDMK